MHTPIMAAVVLHPTVATPKLSSGGIAANPTGQPVLATPIASERRATNQRATAAEPPAIIGIMPRLIMPTMISTNAR